MMVLRAIPKMVAAAMLTVVGGCVDHGPYTEFHAAYDLQCNRVARLMAEQEDGFFGLQEELDCEAVIAANSPAGAVQACTFEPMPPCGLAADATNDTSTDAADATQDAIPDGPAEEVGPTPDVAVETEVAEETVQEVVGPNGEPVLSAPDGSGGDMVVTGDGPGYTALVTVGQSLAVTFLAADSDADDVLVIRVERTGGTLSAEQAGFIETLPYEPPGSTFPHQIALSGTAAMPGTIDLRITVQDGQGGTDEQTLTVTINAPPVIAMPEGIDGGVKLFGELPTLTGNVLLDAPLDLTFTATDADGDDVTVTVDVTSAGTLDGAEAGFNETFPVAPAAMAGTTSAKLTGAGSGPGTVEVVVTAEDGKGGTDSVTLWLIVKAEGFDFNGDGYPDLVVGACDSELAGPSTGAVFIYLGQEFWQPSLNSFDADVSITGVGTDEGFGKQMTSGDINADGYSDLVVAAPQSNSSGTAAGEVYVFFGGSSPGSNLSAANADLRLIGAFKNDKFGTSVTVLDFDGDGFGDIAVGALLGGSPSQNQNDGAAYIFRGAAVMPSVIDADLADLKIEGTSGGFLAERLAALPDVTGDGRDELVVAAPHTFQWAPVAGVIYLFYGMEMMSGPLLDSAADVTLQPGGAGGRMGAELAVVDVDADGSPDVVSTDPAGGPTAGSWNVAAFRTSDTLPAEVVCSTAGACRSWSVPNIDSSGNKMSVGNIGDFDGDGHADLGVFVANPKQVHVLLSGSEAGGDLTSAVLVLDWMPEDDALGLVASVGDLNADGKSDFAVAAPGVHKTMIFYGTDAVETTPQNAAAGDIVVSGSSDSLGCSLIR